MSGSTAQRYRSRVVLRNSKLHYQIAVSANVDVDAANKNLLRGRTTIPCNCAVKALLFSTLLFNLMHTSLQFDAVILPMAKCAILLCVVSDHNICSRC